MLIIQRVQQPESSSHQQTDCARSTAGPHWNMVFHTEKKTPEKPQCEGFINTLKHSSRAAAEDSNDDAIKFKAFITSLLFPMDCVLFLINRRYLFQ